MYSPSLNSLATIKGGDRKILNSMGNIANMLTKKKKKITGVSSMFKYIYTHIYIYAYPCT